MGTNVGAQMAIILLACRPCVSLLIIGTSFVLWVKLPVQRRLRPIFMSGVGLPDIHEYSAG